MTKEEILDSQVDNGCQSHQRTAVERYGRFDCRIIHAAMDEYAEQECIGFHKFINQQSFHYDYRGETFNRISEKDKFYTHKELYQLYLKSKQP